MFLIQDYSFLNNILKNSEKKLFLLLTQADLLRMVQGYNGTMVQGFGGTKVRRYGGGNGRVRDGLYTTGSPRFGGRLKFYSTKY